MERFEVRYFFFFCTTLLSERQLTSANVMHWPTVQCCVVRIYHQHILTTSVVNIIIYVWCFSRLLLLFVHFVAVAHRVYLVRSPNPFSFLYACIICFIYFNYINWYNISHIMETVGPIRTFFFPFCFRFRFSHNNHTRYDRNSVFQHSSEQSVLKKLIMSH